MASVGIQNRYICSLIFSSIAELRVTVGNIILGNLHNDALLEVGPR